MPDGHLPKDTEKEAGGPERAHGRPKLLRRPSPGASVFSAEEVVQTPRGAWAQPEVSLLSSEDARAWVRVKEKGSTMLGPGQKSASALLRTRGFQSG